MNDKKNLTSKQKLGIAVASVFGGLILLGGSCFGCISCMSCMGWTTDDSNSSNSTSTTNNTPESLTETSNKTKSDELKEKYSFYEKSVKEIRKQMKVTQEQADEIFIILVDCGMDREPNYIIGSGNSYTVDVGKIGEGITNYYVTVENGVVSEVKADLKVVYPPDNSNSSSESSNETSSNQAEIPEPRETAIGKSDKEVDWFISPKATTVRNDVTGNWRYSGFSESGIDISEYALSYYNEYFESDDEIHAVINFANKTTTRISCSGGMLFVTVLEYVDGEEHNAKLMFSGEVLQDFIVYTDNGDIEPLDNSRLVVPAPEYSSSISSTSISTTSSTTESIPNKSTSSTTSPITQNKSNVVYIAATGNGTKYHRSKNCSKMNGNVIEMTVEEARSKGYTPCKKSSCYG